MKTTLVTAVLVGIWLAPTAYADPQDKPFLAYLAVHNVAVDSDTAINAAHIACAQIVDGESPNTVDAIVARQVPTINGNEYWIVAGARNAYCPN